MQNVIEPGFTPRRTRSSHSSTWAPRQARRSAAEGTGINVRTEHLDRPRRVAREPVRRGRLLRTSNAYGYAIFRNDFVLPDRRATRQARRTSARTAPTTLRRHLPMSPPRGSRQCVRCFGAGGPTRRLARRLRNTPRALVSASELIPAGVVLCDVSTGDGGGMIRIQSNCSGNIR